MEDENFIFSGIFTFSVQLLPLLRTSDHRIIEVKAFSGVIRVQKSREKTERKPLPNLFQI